MRGNSGSQNPTRAAAFTLLEMLVVVGVVVVLLGMAAVGLNVARNAAGDVASKQFLNGVSMALAQYERDHGDLPPSYWGDPEDGRPVIDRSSFGLPTETLDGISGTEILAHALLGPRADDGATGMTYRQRGRDYGPYLEVSSESNLVYMGNDDQSLWIGSYEVVSGGSDYREKSDALKDEPFETPNGRWGLRTGTDAWPILYYNANSRGATRRFEDGDRDNWIWGPNGRFDSSDNVEMLTNSDPAFDAPFDGAVEGNSQLENREIQQAYAQRPYGVSELSGDAGLIPVLRMRELKESQQQSLATSMRSAKFLLVAPGSDNLFGTETDIVVPGP